MSYRQPSVIRRWMVAGLGVATLIEDFGDTHQLMGRRDEVLYHQTASVQKAFRKDVCSLDSVMEELGNLFEEETKIYVSLIAKRVRINWQ